MNEIIKQLDELKEAVNRIREEIYLHNYKKFEELEKMVDGMRCKIEDEIADMIADMEEDTIRRNLMTVEDMYASQEAEARGIDK